MLKTEAKLKPGIKESIKLFNSVVVDNDFKNTDTRMSETIPHGFIVTPSVASHPEFDNIIDYCGELFVDGEKANSTFHKSWEKIANSSRFELFVHQITHYITTYGFQQLGIFSENTIYIPNEALEIPEITEDIPLVVIHGLSRQEMIDKCLDLFKSGIALNEQTIDDIITILNNLNYQLESVDEIANKEAKLKLAYKYGILPSYPNEFVRFLIFKATGQTLLIKSTEVINTIKISHNTDISNECMAFGLEKLAQVFYRYKPIFLAFKHANSKNRYVINRIRKLAKKYHKPMPEDYLNNITGKSIIDVEELKQALNKVNNFRKIRILYAIQARMNDSDYILYRIRNGKSYIDELGVQYNKDILHTAESIIYSDLVKNLKSKIKGTKIKYPEQINYPLVSSEKKFVGNYPEGTIVNVNENLIAGIYWENKYGARDLDLSALPFGGGKIGWNADYKTGGNQLMYSGDITNAPKGATELIYAKELDYPALLVNNIFSGDVGCRMKVFVASENINKLEGNYTVNPNNMILQADTTMPQKKSILGMFLPDDKQLKFVLTNFGEGKENVSAPTRTADMLREYLYYNYKDPYNLKDLLEKAGCEFVDDSEEADIDLTPQSLEKDTIIDLLK